MFSLSFSEISCMFFLHVFLLLAEEFSRCFPHGFARFLNMEEILKELGRNWYENWEKMWNELQEMEKACLELELGRNWIYVKYIWQADELHGRIFGNAFEEPC